MTWMHLYGKARSRIARTHGSVDLRRPRCASLRGRLQHAVGRATSRNPRLHSRPVARIFAVLIIIITGLTLAFGDTSGGFRKLLQVVFGLTIAFAATSFSSPFSVTRAGRWSHDGRIRCAAASIAHGAHLPGRRTALGCGIEWHPGRGRRDWPAAMDSGAAAVDRRAFPRRVGCQERSAVRGRVLASHETQVVFGHLT